MIIVEVREPIPSGMMRVQDTGRLSHLPAPLPIARVTDHFSKKGRGVAGGPYRKGSLTQTAGNVKTDYLASNHQDRGDADIDLSGFTSFITSSDEL